MRTLKTWLSPASMASARSCDAIIVTVSEATKQGTF